MNASPTPVLLPAPLHRLAALLFCAALCAPLVACGGDGDSPTISPASHGKPGDAPAKPPSMRCAR